jgi:hypothetical protein
MAAPELQQLLAMSRDRTAYQNPLFQAVTQMAYGGLPSYARQGTQLSGTLSNVAPPALASSDGMSPLTSGLLGGLAGAGLNALGPNGNALGALIDGIKKLLAMRNQAPPIQGNKPIAGLNGPTGLPIGNLYDPSKYFPGWPNQPASERTLRPGVTTDEIFGLPSMPFPDFGFPSAPMGYPTDPSGGTGVGPGMQGFRGGQWPVQSDPSEE